MLQTCVKSKQGTGKPIRIDFYAPCADQAAPGQIKYNFRGFGEDIQLVISSNDKEYCMK